ncbi:Z1 domain-containing protein [Amylibacter sp.]|nr:Z1 domain-containing protein [Amylibacter sp.]
MTSLNESDLKILCQSLSQVVFQEVETKGKISRDDIISIVENHPFRKILENETQLNVIIRYLEANHQVEQETGSIIKDDVTPWLNGRKGDIDFYYWGRLKKMILAEQTLPMSVLARLDEISDQILDCCGNPSNEDSWDSRGMVLGHVQSGKTTNYSALIAKAADAGYRVIILLAGITNSLRTQTQQRIDENIIGRKSIFGATISEPLPIMKYTENRNNERKPDIGTSRADDFKKDLVATETPLASLKEPKIFVIKKNKAVLENLGEWLKDQHSPNSKIKQPLLMIDDEADNASINTASDITLPTTINRLMRNILSHFDRSTYIGYTATPFANIFIEPNTEEDMDNEDLFPRNFIKSLDPPSNYCGATRIFSEKGDLRKNMVVSIDDYNDFFNQSHKKTHDPKALPPSLKKAIRGFILAKTIRHIRGDGAKHCSMMVNVSRFNDVQDKVEGLTYDYLEKLKNSIEMNARKEVLTDKNIIDLKNTFEDIYGHTKEDWSDIAKSIVQAVKTIVVSLVNGKKSGNLDYEGQKEHGLHVIAIGGLALSRGLTLEGLCSTYILRRAGAYDTLMQMARWFGYRGGYEDLCKLYLPQESIKHYEKTSEAIEELRDELKKMNDAKLTPKEFGLKVRQSPTGIKITANNKMRTAEEFRASANYSGRYIQAHSIRNDKRLNLDNIQRVKNLIANTNFEYNNAENNLKQTWFTDKTFSSEDICRLLVDFNFPENLFDLTRFGNSSLLVDYIRSCNKDNKLTDWDVCIQSRDSLAENAAKPISGWLDTAINPLHRGTMALSDDQRNILFTGSSAVGDVRTPSLGLTKIQLDEANQILSEKNNYKRKENVFSLVRTKPMLILLPIVGGTEQFRKTYPEDNLFISLACSIPKTINVKLESKTYQTNSVFRNQLKFKFDLETDDDESVLI